MAFTSDNVEQAVLQFYRNAELQQQVHQWLTTAQLSPDAWKFSWELLSPGKTCEVQYFGANSLYFKISRFWADIPSENIEGIKTSLLQKVFEFGSGPKIVLTRLCVSVAAFILHSTPEYWKDPLHSLISTFQMQDIPSLSSLQRCLVLLEILKALPDELCSSNVPANKKSALKEELTNNLPEVLQLLQSLMVSGSPSEVYEQALRCFSSWVDFGIPLNESEGLICQVFESLSNTHLFDTAVEVLVSVFSHSESHRYPNTIEKLLPQVLNLKPMFQSAVDTPEMDVCNGLCQVIVTLAEHNTKLILQAVLSSDPVRSSNVLDLVQLVLGCSSIPGHYPVDEMSSDMPFAFWYTLQDEIMDCEKDKKELLLAVFQPIYFSLIEVLLIKVQYPTDEEYASWTAEEKEQFRCYRQDIGDTMMYSFSVLREPLLGHLCGVLQNMVQTSKMEEVRWQLVEGIFFLFGSVAENVDIDENSYLPAVINLLPRLPFNNLKFISTALYMVGSFGEWINFHPESLNSVIPLLLQGLGNSEVAMAATMALKDVSRENLDHMQPYAAQIIASSQRALESGILKPRECIRLMSCIGQVLSVLEFEEIIQYLNTILTPHVQEIGALVKQEPSTTTKNTMLVKLSMLSWFLVSLDTDKESENSSSSTASQNKTASPKPVLVVLQQILPVLQEVVSKWIHDSDVIEGVCEIFKKSLRNLMDDFAPLSQTISQMLVHMYQAAPHACIIDLAKQLVMMFGVEGNFFEMSTVLLNSICEKTLSLFGASLQDYTDIIDAFMLFLAQILRKRNHLFVEGTKCMNLNGLYFGAVQALCLPEHGTVKSACLFLIELIVHATTDVIAREVLSTQGHLLMDRLLRATGGESPRALLESIADVVFALVKNFPEKTTIWMKELLDKEGYPSSRVTKIEKEQFFKTVTLRLRNKNEGRKEIKEFSLKCRGMFGTEYVLQTAGLM